MRIARRAAEVLGVRRGPAAGLLVMCLSVVAVLAAAHLGHTVVGRPGDPGFYLGRERGFGEVFFMIMTIWTTALLVLLAARTRSLLLAGWAVAFTYLFVDDWFTVHERAGALLGGRFGFAPYVGELVWLAGVAAAVGTVVLVLHLRTRGLPRALSAVLVALAAALFACGVIIDYLHAAVSTPALDPYVTLLEDGGEIAMMSLVVAFLFGVAFVDHRPELRGRWARLSGHAPTSSGRETA